jgi:class 3 adenylate cyclase/ligand-binding sensor domain-containing protein
MYYLFLFLLFTSTIFSHPTKDDYISKTFSSTDGLANNIVSSIVQDKKGFLWIGTYGGLNRYDGREFKTYTMANGLVFDAVRSVFVDDASDDIWVGTELGLSIVRDGKILNDKKEFPFLDEFLGKDIRAINKTRDGVFLIGTTNGLYTIKNKKKNRLKTFKKVSIQIIFRAQNDSIWIGTKKKGIYQLDSDFKATNHRDNEDVISINEEENQLIVSYKDRGLFSYALTGNINEKQFSPVKKFEQTDRYLICKNNTTKGLSFLSQIKNSYFKEDNSYKEYKTENVNSCFIDREGTSWVGTYGSGLIKYYKRKILSYSTKDDLADPNIRYIFQDSKNRLWLGTQANIIKYENGKFSELKASTRGKSYNKVRVVLEDNQERIWFGTENGLFYYDGDTIDEYVDNSGKSLNIYSMDKFSNSLFVLEGNKKIREINLETLEDKGKIEFDNPGTFEILWRIVASLDNKNLYLQSSDRILKLTSGKDKSSFITIIRKEKYNNPNPAIPKKLNKIQAFLPISENHFLIGDDILIIEKEGKVVKEITPRDGLPDGQIVSIIQDKEEEYWIGTSRGLVYYQKGEIILYDKNDGLAGDFCNFNSIAVNDKHAYIGTSEGLSVIERNKTLKNLTVPQVYFTKLKINKNPPVAEFKNLSLDYNENNIQLDAASLSLVAPEKTEYKFTHIFNAEKEDLPYQKTGTKNYYNLPAGKHIFIVKGKNNDGIESSNEGEILLIIKPAFWTTWYFITSVTAVGLGLLYALYTFRVYRIKQENLKLEVQVQQRTKELFAEKETSEKLLLNILPKNIAERLKNGESNIADSFAQVTVLFADIVGFTKLSQTISPAELVSRLNDLFSRFDKISLDLKIEKIKTIGDCYMAVAGLPEIRQDHATLMIEVAKRMLSAIEDFNQEHNTTLAIRIGINTGEVVAGVIGTHKFIYDLWGDSVNTASRMESHGVPGRIHVTASTYNALKDKYQFESRGVMEIKGKGKMETYLLTI